MFLLSIRCLSFLQFHGSLPYIQLAPDTQVITSDSALNVSLASPSNGTLLNPSPKALSRFVHWHSCLGHPSRLTPSVYFDGHLLAGLTSIQSQCEPCILSKSVHHVPSSLDYERSSYPFELVHSDLSRISSVPSLGGSLYYMSFIDDYTRYSWVYFLKVKPDARTALRDFVSMVNVQFVSRILVDTFSLDSHLGIVDYYCSKVAPWQKRW